MKNSWLYIIIVSFSILAFSPSDLFLKELALAFENHRNLKPQFKVQMTLNQDKYAPGDIIWFNAFLLTEDDQFVGGSHILNIYLVNEFGVSVDHWMAQSKDGKSDGHLLVRSTIEPGLYRLIANSDWMRNFDSKYFFKREIEIVGEKKLKKSTKNKSSLKFFPEGGHMVGEVLNNLIIIGDSSMSNKEIVIRNNGDEPVAFVKLGQNGFGSCFINPKKEDRYYVENDNRIYQLPQVELNRPSIVMTELENKFRFTISLANESDLIRKPMYLILTSHGRLVYSAKLNFHGRLQIGYDFSENDIEVGVSRLTLMDSSHQVLAERFFYKPPSNKIKVIASLNSQNYEQREKVIVKLNLTDQSNKPIQGNASIKVIKGELFDGSLDWVDRVLWKDHLNSFSSDFLKSFDDPILINKLMASKQDGRIKWDEFWRADSFRPHFPMSEFVHLRGSVLNKQTGLAPKDIDSVRLLLFLMDQMVGYEAKPTHIGEIDVPFIFGLYGPNEISYFLQQSDKSSAPFLFKADSGPILDTLQYLEIEEYDPYGKYSKRLQNIKVAYHAEANEDDSDESNLSEIFEKEFIDYITIINMLDYVIFPNMEEVIREILPSLQHRKLNNGASKVRIVLESDPKVFAEDDPLYVIDNVPTKDTQLFLQLNPADVIEIGIINNYKELTRLGAIGINGVVLVKTNKRVKYSAKDVIKINGLPVGREFPNRDYSITNNLRSPDFRSTLYWNPSISFSSNGEAIISYYNSDDLGDIKIIVEGFSVNDLPFSNSASYEVVPRIVKN